MGIANQLEINIRKSNLPIAKEKIYKVLEGKLGLKEEQSKSINLLEGERPTLNELDNAILINFENSLNQSDKVVIVIKSQDAETCINFYNVIKEAVNGL